MPFLLGAMGECVNVVFSGHTHLLFWNFLALKNREKTTLENCCLVPLDSMGQDMSF